MIIFFNVAIWTKKSVKNQGMFGSEHRHKAKETHISRNTAKSSSPMVAYGILEISNLHSMAWNMLTHFHQRTKMLKTIIKWHFVVPTRGTLKVICTMCLNQGLVG